MKDYLTDMNCELKRINQEESELKKKLEDVKEQYEIKKLERESFRKKYSMLLERCEEKSKKDSEIEMEHLYDRNNELEDIGSRDSVSGIINADNVAKVVVKEYKMMSKLQAEHQGIITGVPTGFYDLDFITKGLQKKDLILLAGWKHMGKLGLALNIVRHAVIEEHINTAVFSPDISGKEIMKRLFAIELDDEADIIYNLPRKDDEWGKLENTAGLFEKAPLYIDDNPHISMEQVRKECYKLDKENKLGLIVVTDLQYLRIKEKNIANRNKLLGSLKELAEWIDCPVLVISEISTEGERKWSRHPEISDLDNTGYNMQYPDIIILLYSDIFENTIPHYNEESELIIAKNRNGRRGKVRLRAELGNLKFKNMHPF